jgi:hypothetical protein
VHVYTRGAYVSLSIVEAGLIRSLPMMDENPQDASSPPDQEATPSSEPQSPPTEDKPTSTQQPPAGAAASRGPPAPETPQEKKAKEFLAQAEKKIKSSQSFFGGLFGGAAKMEDAADLYVRAANTFKVAKKWREAGDAFCLAADVHMKLDVKHEAGSVLVEAGQVLKREDPKRAVDCYLQAAEIYTDMVWPSTNTLTVEERASLGGQCTRQ